MQNAYHGHFTAVEATISAWNGMSDKENVVCRNIAAELIWEMSD